MRVGVQILSGQQYSRVSEVWYLVGLISRCESLVGSNPTPAIIGSIVYLAKTLACHARERSSKLRGTDWLGSCKQRRGSSSNLHCCGAGVERRLQPSLVDRWGARHYWEVLRPGDCKSLVVIEGRWLALRFDSFTSHRRILWWMKDLVMVTESFTFT